MSKITQDHLLQQILSGTVRNSLAGFLADRQSRCLSKKIIAFYRLELGLFTDWLDAVGLVSLDELTPDVVRRYLLELADRRNKGGVHASYRAIKAWLRWAWDEYEITAQNPIERVKMPTPDNRPLPGIDIESIQKMIDACNTTQASRDKALLMFLLDSGVRRVELCALNIEDLNFTTGAVQIKHGRGNKTRVVYIGQKTKRALRKYMKTRIGILITSLLFATDEAERLSYAGLRQILRRRAADAGLDKTPGAHDFRRAFAITCLRAGVGLAELSRCGS